MNLQERLEGVVLLVLDSDRRLEHGCKAYPTKKFWLEKKYLAVYL
jgi:hypothetical protein